MKFSSLSKDKRLKHQIPLLDGGLNTYLDPYSISDNQLSSSENVWFKNGMLRTRKGISPATDGVARWDSLCKVAKGLKFTDTTVLNDGITYKIAYDLIGDTVSNEMLDVYLVDSNGALKSIGTIWFSRLSTDEFFRFENVFFIVGEKARASGIYAFVTSHCSNYGYSYSIYELSSDLSEWIRLDINDFYTPIIYMNGRGNNYEQSVEVQNFTEDEPVSPESFNMLTNRFKAYYSSDEYSDEFKLPVENLDENSYIECRVYYTPTAFSVWRILAGSSSVEGTFYSGTVILNCDRKNGIIAFTDTEGNPYPVPRMKNARRNNIVVTAHTSSVYKDRIIGSASAEVYNSNIYVYGNKSNPNVVYSARLKNPLYFAEDMKTAVGEFGGRVVAMAVQQNKLIAFKENEIYKIDISDRDSSTYADTLLDTEYDFFQSDKLSTTPIHLEIGCRSADTVALCGSKLIWLGGEGRVYTLATTTYGKENNVYEVSLPIKNELSSLDKSSLDSAFSVEWDGYYMLFIGKKVFLLDYKIKNFGIYSTFTGLKDTASSISWYIWKFPEAIKCSDVLSLGENLIAGCITTPAILSYTAVIGADKDILLNSDAQTNTEYEINAVFSLKRNDLEIAESLKNIDEIFFECSNSSEITIKLYDGRRILLSTIAPSTEERLKRIMPMIRAVRTLEMEISSKGEFAFGKATVYYHKISNAR